MTDKQNNIKEYYQIYENIISQEKLEIDRSLSIEVTDLIKCKILIFNIFLFDNKN